MELKNIECSAIPSGEVEIRESGKDVYVLRESHRDFITLFLEVISDRYPAATANLKRRYKACEANKRYYEFQIVRGFIKCNMGGYDNRMDIDNNGNFHFEFMQCPLAGECKEWRETCFPKENLMISEAENRVLKLIAEGRTVSEIAVLLCISRFTVEKHTNNMLRKLSVHNNASLVDYYHKHAQQIND